MTHDDAAIRRLHALVGASAADRGGLTESFDRIRMFGVLLEAWDVEMTPMTRGDIADAIGMPHDDPEFGRLFDVLVQYGGLVQDRLKAHTAKWVPNPLSAVSAELLTSLEDDTATDRLADLIVLKLERLDPDSDETLDAVSLRSILEHLTKSINAVARQMSRAVAIGTTDELVEATPTRRSDRQVHRVRDAVASVRRVAPQLSGPLDRLLNAAGRYVSAQASIVESLADATLASQIAGASGHLFALLRPEAVTDVTLTGNFDELLAITDGVLFDLPPAVMTPADVSSAVDDFGAPAQPRVMPSPADPGNTDPAAEVETARRRTSERDQRLRRWAATATADDPAPILTEDTHRAALRRLLDAAKVASDPSVPVTADVAVEPTIEPDGDAAISHAIRLRRLDQSTAATRQAEASLEHDR